MAAWKRPSKTHQRAGGRKCRLKKMYANLAMELDTAKYIIEKKL
jgi:hypothetical protein